MIAKATGYNDKVGGWIIKGTGFNPIAHLQNNWVNQFGVNLMIDRLN
jgi:hypothetical protein